MRIAIENHAGDMQGWELRNLIEAAGPDFTGACLDSGNPCWTLEDPHATLDALHPYVLTSHVRDSAVWRTPDGAAVSWVRMGEGNVGIDDYCRKYALLCAGRALSLECIVMGPRLFPYRTEKFWDAYRDVPAWNFERFDEIAERGKPFVIPRVERSQVAQREREDLEASLAHVKSVLNLELPMTHRLLLVVLFAAALVNGAAADRPDPNAAGMDPALLGRIPHECRRSWMRKGSRHCHSGGTSRASRKPRCGGLSGA